MSIALKNLGFGSRDTGPAYQPSAGMYGMMGADAPYEPSAGMYGMMGADPGSDPYAGSDPNALMEYLKKLKKKKGEGGGQGLLDVYQGMKPVTPFGIIGRPDLSGR